MMKKSKYLKERKRLKGVILSELSDGTKFYYMGDGVYYCNTLYKHFYGSRDEFWEWERKISNERGG